MLSRRLWLAAIVAIMAAKFYSVFAVSPQYVDGNLASTCSGNTYSIASRNCSGSDGPGFKTVEEGLRALAASDQLYIRSGSYTIASTYGNVATDDYGGGASSWLTATKISNYSTEQVTITVPGFNFDETITANTKYIIWQGDSRANFIVQGASSGVAGGVGFRTVNGANHIRVQKMTVRNFGQDCFGGGGATTGADHIEVIDVEISGCGDLTNLEHGIYWSNVQDSLIDGVYFHDIQGYAVHIYNSVSGNARITVRNSRIEGRKTGATGTAYAMVFVGADHKAYNNIIVGLGVGAVKYTGCVQSWNPSSNLLWVNNTCYDVTTGAEINASVTGATLKNDIFNTLSSVISDSGTGTTLGTNLCPSAGTGCSVTGSPSFTNAAAGDFTLQSGSTARDAGADLSATVTTDYLGVSRPQNGAFDIGAYEFLVSVGGGGATGNLGKGSKGMMGGF